MIDHEPQPRTKGTTTMYDSTTRFALDNLARQIARADAGELTVAAGSDAIRIAAEQVLRVTSPAAVEDREYHTVDLTLPADQRCGAIGERTGRKCSRRANHVSDTHRCMEISWAVDPVVGDRVRAHGAQGGTVEGPITEITTEGGRVEFMVDLGDIELGFARDEIEVVR